MADIAFTLSEAATILNPPMTEQQLRMIIRALGRKPDGHRHTGKGGHPFDTFDAAWLMKLHAALIPFMDAPASVRQGDGIT